MSWPSLSSACTRREPQTPRARSWISVILEVSHASLISRSLGARRSQAWNPDLETPSVSHITETGKLALSAEMIR
jgi:hypothetical protein